MGKGGTVLGLIGIILGAGGLGFGYFIWAGQATIEATLTNMQSDLNDTQTGLNATQTGLNDLEAQSIWYQFDKDMFYGNPKNTFLPITNMSIIFELETNASIYILFTSRAGMQTSWTWTRTQFFFSIDEVLLQNPYAQVGTIQNTNQMVYYSVALQHYIPDFSAGTHNVTVIMRAEHENNFVSECALSIQSFTT